MSTGVVSALVVRLSVGLVVMLVVFLGFRFFDRGASRELVNIAISVIALGFLIAPTAWFRR